MFVSDVLGVVILVKGIRSVVEEVVVSTTAIRKVVWARGDRCDRTVGFASDQDAAAGFIMDRAGLSWTSSSR
jgi:hypothetical protein